MLCTIIKAIRKLYQSIKEPKKNATTKAQRDLNPGSREEKNETLLQEQDYQLIASVTKKNQDRI